VVYGAVHGNQGYLDLQSPPEGGTRVVFGLPAAAAEPADPPVEDPTPPSPSLVLLADDDPNVRLVLRRVLDDAGYDGREALETFRKHAGRLALAVLDVSMPRCDGHVALREMRQTRHDLPAILISGNFDVVPPEDRHPQTTLWAKPFRPDALMAVVREALTRST